MFYLRVLFLFGMLVCLPSASLLVAQSTPDTRHQLFPKSPTSDFTISTETVSLTVSVTDREGHYRSGLQPEDFLILDNKVTQEITFFHDSDGPASIAIVFDVSGSITATKLLRAQEALKSFIQTSHAEDEYFLVAFNSAAELLVDGVQDSEALFRGVAALKPNGNTALYDGVALGLNQLAHARFAKRALILISDGEDNRSRTSFGELRHALKESAVSIYAIGTDPRPLPRSQGNFILGELANASGGKAYFPVKPDGVDEAFEDIALALRHQYSIGYEPSNFVPDGSWHHIKVALSPALKSSGARVRTREGYIATTRFSSATIAGGTSTGGM